MSQRAALWDATAPSDRVVLDSGTSSSINTIILARLRSDCHFFGAVNQSAAVRLEQDKTTCHFLTCGSNAFGIADRGCSSANKARFQNNALVSFSRLLSSLLVGNCCLPVRTKPRFLSSCPPSLATSSSSAKQHAPRPSLPICSYNLRCKQRVIDAMPRQPSHSPSRPRPFSVCWCDRCHSSIHNTANYWSKDPYSNRCRRDGHPTNLCHCVDTNGSTWTGMVHSDAPEGSRRGPKQKAEDVMTSADGSSDVLARAVKIDAVLGITETEPAPTLLVSS